MAAKCMARCSVVLLGDSLVENILNTDQSNACVGLCPHMTIELFRDVRFDVYDIDCVLDRVTVAERQHGQTV